MKPLSASGISSVGASVPSAPPGLVLSTVTPIRLPSSLVLPDSSVWRASTSPSAYSPAGSSKPLPAPSFQVAPPSVEYDQVAPGSRPATVTVPSMVTPSPSVPVSFANASVGAFGATVSTVSSNVLLTGDSFPATSVAMAVKLWPPSARAGVSKLQFPPLSVTVVPIALPSRNTVTVLPASAVPLKIGVVSSVLDPAGRSPVTLPVSSVAVSIVGICGAVAVVGADTLPAPSVLVTSTLSPLVNGSSRLTRY